MTELLAVVLGLDASVLDDLSVEEQQRMLWLPAATIISCLMAGAAAADAVPFLDVPSGTSVVAAIATGVFVWNLLRLLNAGGGMALHFSERETQDWQPTTWLPMLVFCVIAIVLAQPAMLSLPNAELDQAVHEHRAELMKMRERAAGHSEESAPYAQHLARLQFPVLRLTTLWKHPGLASGFTLLFVLFMSAPLLLREFRPQLIRPYEQLRQSRERERVIVQHRRTQVLVDRVLAKELEELAAVGGRTMRRPLSELPRPKFLDPPFGRQSAPSRFHAARRVSGAQLLDAIRGSRNSP